MAYRPEKVQEAQRQPCHIYMNPAETECFGISKWKSLVLKVLFFSFLQVKANAKEELIG